MTNHLVSIAMGEFQPGELEICSGDTVEWTNNYTDFHTATNEDGTSHNFDTGFLAPGASASHEFAGAPSGLVLDYFCQVHPGMKAKVSVA